MVSATSAEGQEVVVHKHSLSPNFIKYLSDLYPCHEELRLCTDSSIEESEVGVSLVKERAQAVDCTPCAQNALLSSFRLSLILNLFQTRFRNTCQYCEN